MDGNLRDPTIQIWFAQENGNGFGFIELETVEQSEKVLVKLDGMLVMGTPITIKRPTDYVASQIPERKFSDQP